MYWFLGILGVIAVIIAINIIKKIINSKKRAREEAEWKAYVAACEAERKAKEVERKDRVPEIYLKQDEIPFELDDKQIIYVENDCKDIWDWSEKIYRIIEESTDS